LQLFVDGKQLAIRVIGEEDGRFDSTDAVEFYGMASTSLSATARIYWLAAGKTAWPSRFQRAVPGPARHERKLPIHRRA